MPSLIPNDIDDPIAEKYRAQLDAVGQDTRFLSNREIVKRLGDSLIQGGRTNDDIASTYGEGFLSNYLDEKNKPVDGQGVFGDAMASLRRQAIGLGEVALGGVGLAADAMPGELFDPVRDAAMRKAAELSQSAAEGPQPTIDSYADVRMDKPMEVLRYGANLLGGALPSVAQAAATGGVGGLVGVAGKGLLKKRIKKELGDITEEELERLAKKKAFKIGAGLGLGSSSAVMGTGEVYAELYPYTQLAETHEDYIDPDTVRNVSFAGGALVAGLDFVSAGKMLNKLIGIGEKASSDYIKRLLRNLPEGVFLEGATEGAQEFIIMASEKYARGENMTEFTGQEIERMINAGLMGAAGGSQFSMLSAIPGPKTPPREVDDSDKPKLDVSQRPDADTILADRPGETLGFEVGQEVSEPYGISGTIEKIKDGVATVRSTKQDADGVEITKIKQVPVSHLAPVFEKETPAEKPKEKLEDLTVDEKNKKIAKEKKTGGGKGLQPEVRVEVGNEVFNPPKDDYSDSAKAQSVKKVSRLDRDNALSVYDALKNAISDRRSQIRQGDTYNVKGLLGKLRRDGLITNEVYDKAFTNDREALKILRQSGLLGDNYNWQEKTAYDEFLTEETAKDRERKKAETRYKNIDRKGLELNEDQPQVIKKSGSNNFYVVKGIVKNPKQPQEDGYIKVDEFSERALENMVGSDILIDPALLNKPLVERTTEEGGSKTETEYDLVNGKFELPDNINYEKGFQFTLYTPTGKKAKKGFTVEGADFDEVARNITSTKEGSKLLTALRKTLGGVVTVELSDGTTEDINLEVSGDRAIGEIVKLVIGDQEVDLQKIPLDKFTEVNTLPSDLSLDYAYFDDNIRTLLEDQEKVKNVVQFSGNTYGKAFAVYRRTVPDGLPTDSFRVVSTKKNGSRISSYDIVQGQALNTAEWNEGTYDLVGFITADEKYTKGPIDVYYESAETLRDDLVRGGYVKDSLDDKGLPQHNEQVIADVYTKDSGKKNTVSVKSLFRKIRQVERMLALANPDFDYGEISAQYDLDGELKPGEYKEHKDLVRELRDKQEEEDRLKQIESLSGKAGVDKKVFRDQSGYLLQQAMEKYYKEYATLIDLFDRYSKYNKLKALPRSKLKDEDLEFLMLHETEQVFGGKNLVTILNEQHFHDDKERKITSEEKKQNLYDSVKHLLPEKQKSISINNLTVKKLFTAEKSVYAEHQLFRGATIDKVTPELIDKARQSPEALQQLLKYYLVESNMDEAEAGKLLRAAQGSGVGEQGRGAQLRAQGKFDLARDREMFLDDPSKIFKSIDPPWESSAYKLTSLEKRGRLSEKEIKAKKRDARDSKIDQALEKLEKDIPNYKNILIEVFRPVSADSSSFLGEYEASSLDDITQITNQVDAEGRHFAPAIPNRPDLVTGAVENNRKVPQTPADIDADAVLTSQSETSVIAPKENPIGKVNPKLVTLAQAAINRFTEGGDSTGSFSGKLALKKVIDDIKPSYQNGDSLTFWSSMLRGSSSLDNIRIKFMPWAEFRKHARVTDRGVSAGVYRPGANEILITDTFYVDEKVTPDESLANLIVHEMTHVPVRLGMEVGFARLNNDESMLSELAGLNLGIDNEGLAKIYKNIQDVIIPYLREVNKEHGVNPVEYALSSVEEFFAELPSNYELRHILKKARMTPEISKKLGMSSRNPFKTIWQWVRRLIARIVGVEPNLLGTADNYLKSVIKKAQPMGKYMGQLPFDNRERMSQMLFDFDPKVEEAPSDLPTFWGLHKIQKNSPSVYRQVADVIISPGNEYLDGDIAFQYSEKLGLNRKKLYAEMQRAHARYRRKSGYRYSQVEVPDPGDGALDISKKEAGFYIAFHPPSKREFYIQSPQRTETDSWIISEVTEGLGITIEPPVHTKTLKEAKDHLIKTAEYMSDDNRYSQVEVPTKFPNTDPDAGAMVYHEASAAANNEIVRELTKVYATLGESLPDEFKGDDGLQKFIKKFGNKLDDRQNHYAKLLGVKREQVDQIYIGDQGLNRRARDRAMIDGVKYLSAIRNNARKQKAKIGENIDQAKADLASLDRLHEKMKSGKLVSPKELAEALTGKMLNSLHVPQMQKMFQEMGLDGEEITVEEMKQVRERPDLKSKVADAMDAIIEMSDSVETMSKKEMVKRIEGSTDSRLSWLRDSKFALHAFATKAKISVDLFTLLRIAKDKDSDRKKEYMDAIAAITGAKTVSEVNKAYNERGKDRIHKQLLQLKNLKLKSLKIEADYGKKLSEKSMYEALDGQILARETRLRTALGELEPIDIRHGVNMKVMRRKKDKDGNIITSGKIRDQWELDDYRIRYSGGSLADRDGFVKANVSTLEFLRDEKAREEFQHEPWYDIMREQANRAASQPVGDQYFTIRKQAWMAGIESLNARLNRLGYEGKKLAGMLSRTSALFRDINSDTQYYAKRWNVAYLNLMDKLGIDGNNLFTKFYQDLWWWMDNHPEYAGDEESAMSTVWKHLKEYANVSDKSRLNAETKKAMVTLVRRTIEARDFEADYNFNKLGNRIKDDFKVQSLINGEMVDFYRRPVELGYATIPRVLNEAAITDAMFILKKETKEGQGQFSGQWVHRKSSEDSIYKQLRIAKDDGSLDMDTLRSGMAKLFSDDVVDRWANNFLKSDSRKSIFNGPDFMEVGNSFINAMWSEAQRNATGSAAFFNFLDATYDHYRNNGMLKGDSVTTTGNEIVETEVATREDWYFNMLDQFQKKFEDMHRSYVEILRQNDGNKTHNMLMNSPRSLDSRQLASTLPREYFYYDSYDEVTSAVRLQMMIATSVFGRGGSNANALRAKASERYLNDLEAFKGVIQGVTGSRPNGVQSDYSKEVRKQAYKILQGRKDLTRGRSPEKTFEDLFANAAAHGEMEVVFDHLNKYYGSGNVAGPFRDANLPLELLGLQSISVLNNPKSSFWQGLSLTEFPMAFHGMNGMALKATGKGFMTFIDQTFGGILEAMGVNIGQTHRYADYLANTHFRNSEADLTYKEYTSQVGSAGELSQYGMNSMGAKRGVRFMKKMMMHNRKDKKKGSRSPIDWTTPLIGLFPYINSNINHGAGVGAIFAVESEVLKIAKVIEDQNLQNYHNFTAEELGLGKGALEFFIGEKDGYDQMNNLLEGNGLANLSRLAFDFVQRKKQDPNTPVIEKDTGLLINQIAMNEVTGEGFNAKPAALYTNPFWKYFGIFLGWPLWKMARDNRVLQGNSNYVFGKDARTDRATWMAFLKYLSMVSAVYAPAGLAFAMLVDWYDDEVLEKPNNLPPISPWAALPVLGPFMAAQNDPNFSIYSITSRLAKAGVPYGMGIDLANSVFSKGDPYGSSKEFSLDSRIFAWSMLKNVYDAMGNWMHQGEIDYQNVTRPIMYGLGGNSVIQFMDATTAMFDIDSTERRMADYIGSRNIIKKYAWGMGLELRPPAKGYGRPTPTSINVRQMERAAYNFDTLEFREAYQDALDAAREEGEQNPEKAVRDRFKRRLILYNITDGKITDDQLERMFELMEPDERELIQRYMRAHEQYLQMIEVQKPLTKTQQNAYLFSQGMTTGLPTSYQRKDPRLFALGYY